MAQRNLHDFKRQLNASRLRSYSYKKNSSCGRCFRVGRHFGFQIDLFQIIALLFVLTAAFSYMNDGFLRLPTTIGLMLISLVVSMSLLIQRQLLFPVDDNYSSPSE